MEELLRECIQEIIRKVGNKYVLYTKHKKNGHRRRLGAHSSLAGAQNQEKAIQFNK
jgi:hypothetical protein